MDSTTRIGEKMRYGLIGEHLSHSFSKIIHEKLCDYSYELIEVAKNELDSFMTKRDFAAINVTIPYKQAVIPYLHFIDENAEKIGAVNTIVNKNGKLYGYNTDYAGVLYMLKRAGISLQNQTVLVLGSGGTCKTLKAVAKDEGAKEILVASRTASGDKISYDEAQSRKDITVILNASPVGMFPVCDEIPIDITGFDKLCGVVDVIYNPLKTRLLQRAEGEGLSVKTASGLSMLVAQAKYAAEYFLSSETENGLEKANIKEEKIEEILNPLYLNQSNLVLMGMPSCGKTALGKALAKALDRPFIDIDLEIEKETGKSIPEIFAESGESYFRDIETSVIKRVGMLHSFVISTGGGSVLREENVLSLRQNGVLCFIDRPLEHLLVGGNRPLSTSAETIKRMLETRLPLYTKYSDFTVSNDGDFNSALLQIKNNFESFCCLS